VKERRKKIETLQAKVLQISPQSKEGLTSNQSFKVKARLGGMEILVLVACSIIELHLKEIG